ncbi:hypothetical protein BHM03_00017088 [Ensete ventricosum]|nr:hypothetical protein BHM03_00017088 [Ensete ventricosum]
MRAKTIAHVRAKQVRVVPEVHQRIGPNEHLVAGVRRSLRDPLHHLIPVWVGQSFLLRLQLLLITCMLVVEGSYEDR